uniref:Uncharacterized protein n=1 Tax=Cacopsylla melanoneura TaxID=428564 RepID=A0A8D8M9S7_9HEMI
MATRGEWAQVHRIDYERPNPADVAQFLAHLYTSLHLSPASIRLHKTVITTWINPDVSAIVSAHPIVLKVLKGITTEKRGKKYLGCRPTKTMDHEKSPFTNKFLPNIPARGYPTAVSLRAKSARPHPFTDYGKPFPESTS